MIWIVALGRKILGIRGGEDYFNLGGQQQGWGLEGIVCVGWCGWDGESLEESGEFSELMAHVHKQDNKQELSRWQWQGKVDTVK